MHRTGLQVAVDGKTKRCQLVIRPASGRLHIDKALRRQDPHGLGQRLREQGRVKRRIKQHQVHAGGSQALERGHTVRPLDPHRCSLQARLQARQLGDQGAVLLDQPDLTGAARGGFKAQGAGTGKGVDTAPATQVLPEPIEQGFAHAVGGWAQPGHIGNGQAGALPLAANDPDF